MRAARTLQWHFAVVAAVLTLASSLLSPVAAEETMIDYTYTCSGSAPVTTQIAQMPCGCLAERKQLTRTLACLESAQFAAVIAACRTCAKRSDCNCSAPAEVRHSPCLRCTNQSHMPRSHRRSHTVRV